MDSILSSAGQILASNPLLLLFVVAAIGYPLGHIKIGGGSLGVAAVLFVGLAFGAMRPDLKLPEIVYMLGLVLFVYTVGLSSGPGFVASVRGKGLRDNLFVLTMIAGAAGLAVAAHALLGLRGSQTAGLFAGSLTNTPALAAVLDYLKGTPQAAGNPQLVSDPVVSYSLAYPVSVLGMIMAIYFAARLWKVNYAAEAHELAKEGLESAAGVEIHNRTIRVVNPKAEGVAVSKLVGGQDLNVVFGRVRSNGSLNIVTQDTRFRMGDLVTAVGSAEDLDRATLVLGETCGEGLELDRHELDYRRIFVSNPKLAGQRLRELDLPHRMDAVITRIRRGDVELLPNGNTVLELGDRVRVLTAVENLPAVTRYFGDSYRAVSEIDILSFSLGLALGLLLGLVPIPVPGGPGIKLGLAGGPLIMALVLGALGRTGPITWSLPYTANLMLRQVGLVLFLAGIGTRAGYDFYQTLTAGGGVPIFLAAAGIVCVTALVTLWIGHKVLKVPMGLLSGMLAALQTQPATLGFALEQAGNELPNIGYARVFPVAAVAKIVVAQLLVTLLT